MQDHICFVSAPSVKDDTEDEPDPARLIDDSDSGDIDIEN